MKSPTKSSSYSPAQRIYDPPKAMPNRQKLSGSYGSDGRAAGVNRGVSGANKIPTNPSQGQQSSDKPAGPVFPDWWSY